MFPDHICQNLDILTVMNARKIILISIATEKLRHKHQLNNLHSKYQVCEMKLKHLNTFLQFRLLFHEPHCKAVQYARLLWGQLRSSLERHVVRPDFDFDKLAKIRKTLTMNKRHFFYYTYANQNRKKDEKRTLWRTNGVTDQRMDGQSEFLKRLCTARRLFATTDA